VIGLCGECEVEAEGPHKYRVYVSWPMIFETFQSLALSPLSIVSLIAPHESHHEVKGPRSLTRECLGGSPRKMIDSCLESSVAERVALAARVCLVDRQRLLPAVL
jgi:hypothetical protein